MSNLFVGQRVRIVGGDFPHVIGVETRIVAKAYGPFLPIYEWIITVDGEEWGALSRHLEPILYDGDRAGLYSISELLGRCKQGEGVPA